MTVTRQTLSVRTSSNLNDWMHILVDFVSNREADLHWEDYYYQLRRGLQSWLDQHHAGKTIWHDLERSILPADKTIIGSGPVFQAPPYNADRTMNKVFR